MGVSFLGTRTLEMCVGSAVSALNELVDGIASFPRTRWTSSVSSSCASTWAGTNRQCNVARRPAPKLANVLASRGDSTTAADPPADGPHDGRTALMSVPATVTWRTIFATVHREMPARRQGEVDESSRGWGGAPASRSLALDVDCSCRRGGTKVSVCFYPFDFSGLTHEVTSLRTYTRRSARSGPMLGSSAIASTPRLGRRCSRLPYPMLPTGARRHKL